MRQRAIRIKHLPTQTVKFENVMEHNVSGTVTKDVLPGYWNQRSPSKNQVWFRHNMTIFFLILFLLFLSNISFIAVK